MIEMKISHFSKHGEETILKMCQKIILIKLKTIWDITFIKCVNSTK
jgi:hypothetical protein